MSVRKKDRKPSSVQFITTAADICTDIQAKCRKMSKNARYQIGFPLKRQAEDALYEAMYINEIRSTDQLSSSYRRLQIKSAIARYKQMSYMIQEYGLKPEIAQKKEADGKTISAKQWVALGEMIYGEIQLLDGLYRYEKGKKQSETEKDDKEDAA